MKLMTMGSGSSSLWVLSMVFAAVDAQVDWDFGIKGTTGATPFCLVLVYQSNKQGRSLTSKTYERLNVDDEASLCFMMMMIW